MCGILVFQSLCPQTLSNWLQKRPAALSHLQRRGPDASDSVLVNNNCSLSHTRLSITGLSNGSQPIETKSPTSHLFSCVNAEIYDWKKHRQFIQNNARHYKSDSDSEVIPHLYDILNSSNSQKSFTSTAQALNGEWACVIYDKNTHLLTCARDPWGTKPLYYHTSSKGVIISSSIKSILTLLGTQASLDWDTLLFTQMFQYQSLQDTFFKDIKSVCPGEIVEFDLFSPSGQSDASAGIKKTFYHSWRQLPPLTLSSPKDYEELCENARSTITQSVLKRIPQEVPWCTHLSSGLDSSIVSAICATNYKNDFCAYSVGFPDNSLYDEAPMAKKNCDYWGIKHKTINLNHLQLLQATCAATSASASVSINLHLGAKYLLAQQIKLDGKKVYLSGEGSDEMFMGYSHLKTDCLGFSSLGGFERSYLSGVHFSDEKICIDSSTLHANLGFIPSWINAKLSMQEKFRTLYTKDFLSLSIDSTKKTHTSFLSQAQHTIDQNRHSSLHMSSALWSQYCMSGYILRTLDDAQSMHHSLEGRLAFLDKDVFNLAWQIPQSVHFKTNIEKQVLRDAFKDLLPTSVASAQKQAFMSSNSVDAIATNKEVKEYYYSHLMSSRLIDKNIISAPKLQSLLDSCQSSSLSWSSSATEPILMTLLTLTHLFQDYDIV